MPIIGTLPVTLTNGTTADATQVMSDLNYIVNQVNANANPTGTLTAPSGTRAVFQQASAPTGWTVDASSAFTDASMRWNNTGIGSGGTVNWSSWNFGGVFNLNAFTLSVAQLPVHNHGVTDPGHGHGVTDPQHSHTPASGGSFYESSAATVIAQGSGSAAAHPSAATSNASTNISVNSAVSNISIQNTGSGSTITPTITTPNVKFADCVVGIKT